MMQYTECIFILYWYFKWRANIFRVSYFFLNVLRQRLLNEKDMTQGQFFTGICWYEQAKRTQYVLQFAHTGTVNK